MKRLRNMIQAARLSWSVRHGPCIHPFYCCQMDAGRRWWFGGRP